MRLIFLFFLVNTVQAQVQYVAKEGAGLNPLILFHEIGDSINVEVYTDYFSLPGTLIEIPINNIEGVDYIKVIVYDRWKTKSYKLPILYKAQSITVAYNKSFAKGEYINIVLKYHYHKT